MSTAAFPCRTDTYQTPRNCAAVVYTRGHKVENLQVHAEVKSLTIELTVDGVRSIRVWAWFAETDPESAKVDQGGVKIEICVAKRAQLMWPRVESSEEQTILLYEKWSKVQLPKEEEEKGEGIDHFLSKIYGDANDDVKRAMMKSMYESQGTVLSTNWGEVGQKKVDPYKSDEEKAADKAKAAQAPPGG